MRARGYWLRIGALVLLVAIPMGVSASYLAEGAWSTWYAYPILEGELLLFALWSALSNTPQYVRWPCGYLALWAACPAVGPDFAAPWAPHPHLAASAWLWQMAWEVVPHVLLTFMSLCVLRELGLRIHLPTDDRPERAHGGVRWQFTLRKLLTWVAGTALLVWIWKQAIVAAPSLRPQVPLWPLVAVNLVVSQTVIDLTTVWAILRPGRVRWRVALLLIVVAAMQILVWHYGESLLMDRSLPWNIELGRIRAYDQWSLCPMLLALFIVRSGGYRWTASRSLSP